MIRRLALFLLLLSLASANSLSELDRRLSASLEGSNRLPLLDISLEAFALTTPAVEWGWVFHQWQTNNSLEQYDLYKIGAFSLLTTYAATGTVKYFIRRERPERKYQPRLWNTRITPSFPSGHVAASSAWATVAAHHFPESAPLLTSYVILSVWSQVYVGNHYLSDAIAGTLLGWMMGRFALDKMGTNSAKASPYIQFSFSL